MSADADPLAGLSEHSADSKGEKMLIFNKHELEHHRKRTGNAAPEPSVERELCWSCGCERSAHYHGGIGPGNTPPIVSGCGKCRECSFYWDGPMCERPLGGGQRCERIAGHEGPCACVVFFDSRI